MVKTLALGDDFSMFKSLPEHSPETTLTKRRH
jgi:hypothetical protein